MFNLNRRKTEAAEKSARAKKRLADAEETIAQNLGAFLRDNAERKEEPPTVWGKSAIPSKNQSPKK